MNKIIKTLLLTMLLALFCSESMAQEERKFVRRGNKEYDKNKFAESEVNYLRALKIDSTSNEGLFNLSNALYQQGRYDDALKHLQTVATDSLQSDVDLTSIDYNIGNIHFQKKEYDKAIESYKKTLRKNPSDAEAKFNLAYAQLMLDNQQDQDQDNDDENKDDQDKDDQDKDQKDQDKKDQEDKEDQEDQQDKKDQQDQDQQEENQEQPNEDEMNKEDAEQLLQAIQNNEDKTQKKVKEHEGKGVVVKGKKNW